ncbi:hypothetical protein DM02DRAFT_677756 [Periconia macrospinosa]|uniref:Uncharacterized protein n=1 Tax=Periconia macrospinosa TaxID=97972 RepID=A0A2V1D476_9PLEO|nr:hypothetical protein DM02DRAFT_677756 [Periconia macrospinosa]
MSQEWMIGNLDQRSHLQNDEGASLLEIVLNGLPGQLIQQIHVPEFASSRHRCTQASIAAAFLRNRNSALVNLPQEILDSIVGECATDPSDLVSLSLSCCALFHTIAPFLCNTFAKSGTWAGDRLICISEYAGSCPATVGQEELKEWADVAFYIDWETSDPASPFYEVLRQRYTPVQAFALPLQTKEFIKQEWSDLVTGIRETKWFPRNHYNTWTRYHEKLKLGQGWNEKENWNLKEQSALLEKEARKKGFAAELDVLPEPYRFPIVQRVGAEPLGRIIRMMVPHQPSTLYLRNLSRKEFVKCTRKDHKSWNWLGGALCSQILWTDHTDESHTWAMKGPWAGDRFDVRGTVGWVQKAESWKDVTADVGYPANI